MTHDKILLLIVIFGSIPFALWFYISQEIKIRKEEQRQIELEKIRLQKRMKRIRELEVLARKGDLIAFQEWKNLTGRHDVVDVRSLPDMVFFGVSF